MAENRETKSDQQTLVGASNSFFTRLRLFVVPVSYSQHSVNTAAQFKHTEPVVGLSQRALPAWA